MTAAELDWVHGVLDDLRAGTLRFFTPEEIREMAQHFTPRE